ncbi:MAG: DMT family transporter [Bacteroidota bacterium]
MNHLGEIAAIGAAICWTGTALVFESVTRKAGNLAVNTIKLSMALILMSLLAYFWRGFLLPFDANTHQVVWLVLSGIVGFVIGDICLFQAYIKVGSRVSMLIMSLAPPITAAFSWPLLGEPLNTPQIAGILVTVSGIILVVLKKEKNEKRIRFRYSFVGILLAFGGAAGQAAGLMMSKFGMDDYDFISATQIRVISGMTGFWLVSIFSMNVRKVLHTFRDKWSMRQIAIGAIFGPFIGVSLSLLAVQNSLTGVASTLMAIVPILIIPPAVFLFKEKVTAREIIGASISVIGVAILFLF